MKFTRSHCRVQVWLYGELIAYARDEPNLVHRDGMYRKEGRSTFEYFVNGSALVEALGLQQCEMQGGYRSLRQAGEALVHVLSKVGE